jgi:hypothetical protein
VDQEIKNRQDWERLVHIQESLDFSQCHHKGLEHLQGLDLCLDDDRRIIREGAMDVVVGPDQKKGACGLF